MAIDGLMNSHNLANEGNLNIWNALTGTTPQQEPFWAQFKSASRMHNSIVHEVHLVDRATVETALQAPTDLITHLE